MLTFYYFKISLEYHLYTQLTIGDLLRGSQKPHARVYLWIK